MPEKITGDVEIIDGRLIVKNAGDPAEGLLPFAPPASIVIKDGRAGLRIDGPKGAAIRLSTRPGIPGLAVGEAPAARIVLGADDLPGILTLIDNKGKAKFILNGSGMSLMRVINESEKDVLRFDAKTSALEVGGAGSGGDIRVRDQNDRVTVQLEGASGDLKILDDSGAVVIHLDRKARDIKLKGADCAEIFATHNASALEPGSLCVIGPSGALEPCTKAYDTRVAGVVAGAGDLHPGIVLGQGTVPEQSVALSVTGRVWCKVDASFGPIVPGDLVTTSTTPGHGMRADDRSRLTGAIAGKALAALSDGCEIIPILVGLQ